MTVGNNPNYNSPYPNVPNLNMPSPIKENNKKEDTTISMVEKKLDGVNNEIKANPKDTPPLPGQIFIDKVLPNNYQDNISANIDMESKGDLEIKYNKEQMKQLEAENKEKQKALLSSRAFPPMEIDLKENPKNLFNLNI